MQYASAVDLAAEFDIGTRWIVPQESGIWLPGEETSPGAVFACLLPVCLGANWGKAVDIVGWELGSGGIPWWRRMGIVTHLGALQLEEAERHMGRVKLVATPREWMKDRSAVCILDWQINVAELFARIDAVDCGGNDALKRTLADAIKKQALRLL